MVAVCFLLSFVTALLTTGVSGKAYRAPCKESYRFRCDNGICINKHQWCDGSNNCNDRSDEKYCSTKPLTSTCTDFHFQCDNGMCIPVQGYCDGYSSCSDQSDEKNCPCEELYEREGNILYEAYVDSYRTQQKCWKISVNKGESLELKVYADFKNRDCIYGNLTLYVADELSSLDNSINGDYVNEDYNHTDLFCPSESGFSTHYKSFTFGNDVYIRYRSNYYTSTSNSYKDLFNVTFHKVDMMCERSDAFKCSKVSCISPEKQCDGHKDCENGLDEENCDYGALSAPYLVSSRMKATRWMRSQHNADWGWKMDTPRAIVALRLAGDANVNGSSKDDDLIAKQLELEIFTYLLREKFDEKTSSTELASYINALLVLCRDPRNFYGFDLIAALRRSLQTDSSFSPPFPYLALCNAGEPISEHEVDGLLNILEFGSTNHGFILEIQALTTMVLTCIIHNGNPVEHLAENVTEALNNFKKQQMEDGSFGNEHTTALVLQALFANNQENAKDWNPKSSLQFLSKSQEADGDFGDFLTTYLIMPILNAKSLVDIGKINCEDRLKRSRRGNAASDIRNRFGKKIVMQYSLFIGDEKDQIHPILLRTPENITVVELMTLAADLDPKYKFKIHEMGKKKYIYEISNITNDPENNMFWFIYQGSSNDIKPFPDQSLDKIKIHEKDHIIMWYKTLDSL